MNRALLSASLIVCVLPCSFVAAQESGRITETEDGRVVIDILAPPADTQPPSEAEIAACRAEMEAALVTQEIIVCGEYGGDASNWFSGGREAWLRKYAEETAFVDAPRTPDVAGAGIFRGPATVSGLCFIPPCPEEPAILIDVEALPDAPAGSDADRIARGLAPLEEDDEEAKEERIRRHQALGLPPPEFDNEEEQ